MYACTCTDEFYRNDGFTETNPKKSFIHMGKQWLSDYLIQSARIGGTTILL